MLALPTLIAAVALAADPMPYQFDKGAEATGIPFELKGRHLVDVKVLFNVCETTWDRFLMGPRTLGAVGENAVDLGRVGLQPAHLGVQRGQPRDG